MYREQNTYHSGHAQAPFAQRQFPAGSGRHRAPTEEFTPPADAFTVPHTADAFSVPHTADAFAEPLAPPDADWDPAEELAYMLQDSKEQQPTAVHDEDPSALTPAAGTPLANLQRITAELPALRGRRRARRRTRCRRGIRPLRAASLTIAALVAVIASSVSLLSGMAAYGPLRLTAAEQSPHGVVAWWPLLVYGPWLVASLSVLRAALHRRRAVHSWAVVLLFSAIAMLLCVLQAPRTLGDTAAAALPGLASLVCFQQVVRQVTLSRPPRRAVPRHRQAPDARPAASGGATGTSTKGKGDSVPRPRPRPPEPRSRGTAPNRDRTPGTRP
jgi:hypothetical protein